MHSFIQLPLFILSYTHFSFPLCVKLRAAKSKPACCFNWSKYLRRTKHYKHHWKQSGLYGSIQKPKPAINHKSVYHCLSSQRSALCNNRNAFSIYNIGRWDFGDAVCQMQGFIDVFSTYATPATLGLTAINRYVKIVKTNHYKKYFSPLRSKIWLCCVWIFLLLYLLTGQATNLLSFEFVPGFEVCALGFANMRVRIVHFCMMFGLFFTVPLCSGMFSYYKVLSTTHQHQVNTAPSLRYRTNCGGSSSLKEIQVTRVLLYVASGFLCCWIPVWAFILWKRFSPETCPWKAANLVTFFLFLSATINPFIYAFTNCGFQTEFRKLLCCRHASNQVAVADVDEVREREDEANV